ncbi:YvrJ family protein [Selenomonas sputigena]|uniref:YvrJ family protein n=1 Tax=Selenomonas sputigena TaxID=69823 RepID=A0ABV3X4W3_9FIRM
MGDLLAAFGSYGFPMGVTAFLLVRIETKLSALNDSIRELSGIIAKK